MAKNDKKNSKVAVVEPAVKKESAVVIDIDKMLVPFSILIAGLMISLSIVFTLKGAVLNTGTNTGNGNTNVGTDTGTDPTPTPGDVKVSVGDGPYLGDKKKAKIAIVEFSDYECPFCQRHYNDTHKELVKNYVDTGDAILVFRDFPLSFHEPKATQEALAARCAFDLGGNSKYFAYHDLIFEQTRSNGQGFSDNEASQVAKLEEFAKTVGVDQKKWKECFDSEKYVEAIKKDLADGSAAGVTGTPGFVIGKLDKDGNVTGGTLLAGAYPYADFKAVLDKLLEE